MANDGQVVFEISADADKAKATIKDVTKTIDSESKKWDKAAGESAENINGSFSGMLKKLTAGFSAVKIGKALLDIGKDAVQAASDLQEVQNVVDTTFGANANKVETWAKNAGKQFGLTETQAKRFSSTMGAMLKSSGMAGDEIVDVSTDLAGLAADMASFYNLDFEEAFSKIRSGISGQTMPLKELGIDMSVATLNAFALQQGLTKTFDQMSQSEQVMLRYQYLMTATADAQGDFAKTSDSYANGMRQFETNLTSFKTNLGNEILPFINSIVQGINTLFPETARDDSILHQLADVNLKKDQRLAEISAIRTQADELIKILDTLGQDENAGSTLGKIADNANKLNAASATSWEAVLTSLKGIDGLSNLFGDGSGAIGTVEGLAQALSGNSVTTTKANAWKTFLSALADNSDSLTALTGTSADETEAWLRDMAAAAGDLSPDDAESWNKLMTALVGGVGMDTDEGKKFVETLAENFLALGSDSEDAVNGLRALGYGTTEIEQKQATWLATVRELAKTIPGLSSIIDTNTGEVKGGIPALKAYADEWERTAKYQAEIEALRSAYDIYNENNNQAQLNANMTAARAVAFARLKTEGAYKQDDTGANGILEGVKAAVQQIVNSDASTSWDEVSAIFDSDQRGKREKLLEKAGFDGTSEDFWGFDASIGVQGRAKEAILEYAKAVFDATLIEKERPIVLEQIEKQQAEVAKEYDKTTDQIKEEADATGEAAKAMGVLEKAANGEEEALKQVQDAVANAEEALTAMADYAQSVKDKVASAIDSTVHGFDAIKTPAMQAAEKTEDLTKKLKKLGDRTQKNAAEWDRLNEEIHNYNAQKLSGQGVAANLEQQAKWMETYLANLERARKLGISEEVLAQLSDGTAESYDVLAALAEETENSPTIERINKAYADVQEKKKQMTDELTKNQLTVDKTYESLAQKAKEAVDALDLQSEAAENTGKTIEGVAQGIGDHVDSVKTQVDAIIAQLDRLKGFGIDIDFGGFGKIHITTSSGTDASGRFGVDYVPRDDYIIRAHEGERLLTAQENQIWNTLLNGGVAGFDLEMLGGVMRDNVKAGGNVYLDGRAVGNVISDVQGRSFKSLQRSGWQA